MQTQSQSVGSPHWHSLTRLMTVLCLAMALVVTLLSPVAHAEPDVTVTVATGGTGISIDTTSDGGNGTYTPLGNIVITEGAADDIATSTTEIVLSPPEGFAFNPAAGAVAHASDGDITDSSILVTAEAATVTLTVEATETVDTVTISELEVHPTNQQPTAGHITASGDFEIAGIADGEKSFGELSSVPGDLHNFLIEIDGGGSIGTQFVDESFALQFTARDQFNNTLNNVNGATGFAGTVDVSSNVAGSEGLDTTAEFVNGFLGSHDVTLTETADDATITVTHTSPNVATTSGTFTVAAAPAFSSATTNTSGTTITVTFSDDIADPAGTQNDFSFAVNGGTPRNITQVEALGSDQAVLTLDGDPIASGDTVTLSYTGSSLSGSAGGVVPTFTDEEVTNIVPAPSVPEPSPVTGTQENVAPGGTVSLLADGTEVSASQPIDVSVTTPVGGTVSISTDTTGLVDGPTGFSMLGLSVVISAPTADPLQPLQVPFSLHTSLFDDVDPMQVVPLRNGVPIGNCTGPASVASPDPCVASRSFTPAGNLVITVQTSAASSWTFGAVEQCLPHSFADVTADSTHATSLDCGLQFGIVRGFGDARFGPTEALRRDQMASMLFRTLESAGRVLPEATDGFEDVAGNVHADAIGRLAAAGIVSGISANAFSPDAYVRRDEMASLLVQAAAWAGVSTDSASPATFTDIAGNTHEASIESAVALGLTVGQSSDTFNPDGTVRRDQIATFLVRLYTLVVAG